MDASTVARVCAIAVGCVLAVAGASKAVDFEAWKRDVAAQDLPVAVAFVVPPAEILLGASLIAFSPMPISLGLATLMLLIFTVFLAVSVLGRSQVPCACFGSVRRRPPRWLDVWRNVALLTLLIVSAATA